MRVGLNAGFGSWIGEKDLNLIKSLGFGIVRQDICSSDPEEVKSLVSEFVGFPMMPIFIIGSDNDPASDVIYRAHLTADACRKFGIAYAIEVCNEPDNHILSPRWSGDPVGWGSLVSSVVRELPLVTVISGGVMSTSKEALDYLSRAMAVIPNCIIGVHTYRSGSPDAPMPGYKTRKSEFDALHSIAGDRKVWCTEIGWNDFTKVGGWIPSICGKPLSEDQVAANFKREIQLCSENGLEVLIAFQLNDGTGADEHFGIRKLDGTLKKSAYIAK